MMKRFIHLTTLSTLLLILLTACSQNPVNQTLVAQDFGTAEFDFAEAVFANSAGVYVTGRTGNSLDGPHKGGFDAYLRSYNGGVVWAQQFGTRVDDIGGDVVADSVGNSYVFGYTNGALGLIIGNFDCFLRKYNKNSVLQWTRQFGTTGGDSCWDMTIAGSHLYTLSMENNEAKLVIRKWNSNGSVLLTKTLTNTNLFNLENKRLALDTTGNIYMAASVSKTGGFDTKLYKFTSTGVLVAGFPKTIAPSATLGDMKIDGVNDLYISYKSSAAFLRKLTSNGSTIWTKKLEPPVQIGVSTPSSLAIDSNNNVYVGGFTGGAYAGYTNAGGSDLFALKYNPAGTRLWTRQLGAGDADQVFSIAVSDAVYLVGTSLSNPNLVSQASYGLWDAFLVQLDLATGEVLGIDQ